MLATIINKIHDAGEAIEVSDVKTEETGDTKMETGEVEDVKPPVADEKSGENSQPSSDHKKAVVLFVV